MIAAPLRLWLLCLLAGLSAVVAAEEPPSIAEPSQASRLRSDAADLPDDASTWEAVQLPDNRRPALIAGREPAAWYRIEFDVSSAELARESWAAYVPYLRDGGRFFLNGRPLERIAESSDSLRVKWERPHLIPLPDTLLREGRNVLTVRTQPRLDVGFPQISFGPAVELLPLQGRRQFWVLTMPQITIVGCAVVALFTLLIWARRPSERLYGLFGLTVLFWGLRTLTFVIETLPMEHWWSWRLIYHASTGGFIALLAVFAARFAGIFPRRSFWQALFAYWLICPVAMVIFGNAADLWMHKVWIAGFIPVALAAAAMVFHAAWRQRTPTAYAMLAGLMLAVLSGIHDYLLIVGWLAALLPGWDGHRIFLMHHGANLMLVVMGGILTERFIHVLSDLEHLNQSLENRVAEREAQLEQNFRRLTLLERERATVEERQRIMQDLHDGMGSQLFASLSKAERGALAQGEMTEALRSCIVEMRLALEALASADDDCHVALADFRFRWERQLEAAGIGARWQIDAPEHCPKLPPQATLQLLRILQEALANVIKHAQARQVQVRIAGGNGGFRIEIEDDGVGMPANPQTAGHGLANMRRRARQLGASVEVTSRPGCTRVSVSAGRHPTTV